MKSLVPSAPAKPVSPRGLLRSIGPAVVVASIVLGPGSILTSSKVGAQYGYGMVWVLICAGFLMFAITSLAARLGVACEESFCSEIRRRLGPGLAVLTGVSVFLIAACFQFGNNIGVLAACEGLLGAGAGGKQPLGTPGAMALLALLNGLVLLALFGLKQIYRHLEKIMVGLVLLMIGVFAINILFAAPSFSSLLQGLVPSWPEGEAGRIWPVVRDGKVFSPAAVLVGLVATTCSFAGAFYHGYLVREKGWTHANLGQQRFDTAAGITVLVGISLVIMLTSASVLHGRIDPDALRSVVDVAAQLKPLLGTWGNIAVALFSLGLFAAAFSSFLGNAMVGGVLLSDGLGFDCRLQSRATRWCTALGLFTGMVAAVSIRGFGMDAVPLIILGQGLTVLGTPLLVFVLLYLAARLQVPPEQRMPNWLMVCGGIGLLLAVFLAIRTAWNIWLSLRLS